MNVKKNIKKIIALSLVLLGLSSCKQPNNLFPFFQKHETSDSNKNNKNLKDIQPSKFELEKNNNNFDNDIQELVFQEGENPFLSDSLDSYEEEFELENINFKNYNADNKFNSHGLQSIYYDYDRKNIRSDQQSKVTNNLNLIQNLSKKNYNFVVEGHACDSAGSPHYNLLLSEDRAKGIAKYFEQNGVNKGRIKFVGRGSEMKIVPFGNKHQQAPNRRVEIYAYLDEK